MFNHFITVNSTSIFPFNKNFFHDSPFCNICRWDMIWAILVHLCNRNNCVYKQQNRVHSHEQHLIAVLNMRAWPVQCPQMVYTLSWLFSHQLSAFTHSLSMIVSCMTFYVREHKMCTCSPLWHDLVAFVSICMDTLYNLKNHSEAVSNIGN